MNVSSELLEFTLKERGKYKFELGLDTTLQKGLKIFGDDATEFFIKFSKRFNVDISEIELDIYFEDEYGPNIFLLADSNKTPITLKDMENSIKAGKWIKEKN